MSLYKGVWFICLYSFLDEDLPGDHLLGETTVSLKKLLQLQQTQKKLQLQLERPNLKVGITYTLC